MATLLLQLLLVLLVMTTAEVLGQTCVGPDVTTVTTACVNNTLCVMEYSRADECVTTPTCGVPCGIVCAPGEYVDAATGTCMPCGAGQYLPAALPTTVLDGSNFGAAFASGALLAGCLVQTAISGQPPQSCTQYPTWQAVEDYLDDGVTLAPMLLSGKYADVNNIESSLSLKVYIGAGGGTVAFVFRVYAEFQGCADADGLLFEVDHTTVMNKVCLQQQFKSSPVYHLTAGEHVLIWKFSKDRSVTILPDRANILQITITGTSDPADPAPGTPNECLLCSPGTSTGNETSQTACTACATNTFAASAGEPFCTDCPAGTVSAVGAFECSVAPACTLSDFYFNYSACSPGTLQRTVTYFYVEPIRCDVANGSSVALPSPVLVPCEPCNPGTNRDAATGACVACAPGSVSADGVTPCSPCLLAGTQAVPVLTLSQFYSDLLDVPPVLSRSCSGFDCSDRHGTLLGWVPMGDYVTTGLARGTTTMTLTLSVDIVDPVGAFVRFVYDTTCTNPADNGDDTGNKDCQITFTVNGVADNIVRDTYNQSGIVYTQALAGGVGPHVFVWKFAKITESDVSHYVTIHSIVVSGTSTYLGGGVACSYCYPGYFSASTSGTTAVCTAECPPGGTSSAPVPSSCTPCPVNTFALTAASPGCLPCGEGTSTNGATGSVDCVFPNSNRCEYTVPTQPSIRYDVSAFSSSVAAQGPLPDSQPDRSALSYYWNLCSRAQTPAPAPCAALSQLAFVCQYTGTEAISLGQVQGFRPLASSGTTATMGLVVVFTNGSSANGCAPRSTTVTILCDPSETAAGGPAPTVTSPVYENPDAPCAYAFTVTSPSGCYLCTEADYEVFVGVCEATAGSYLQTVSYRWKVPKVCRSGVALPQDVQVACNQPDIEDGGKVVAKRDENIIISLSALLAVLSLFTIAALLRLRGFSFDPRSGYNELR